MLKEGNFYLFHPGEMKEVAISYTVDNPTTETKWLPTDPFMSMRRSPCCCTEETESNKDSPIRLEDSSSA